MPRFLTFPTDRTVGTVTLQDLSTGERRPPVPAVGDIEVPDGCAAGLGIQAEGLGDVAWVKELAPDGVSSIMVGPGVPGFDDAAADAVAHLSSLSVLAVLDQSEIGDEGVMAIARLTSLKTLILAAPRVTDLSPLGALTDLAMLVVTAPSLKAGGLRGLASLDKVAQCALVVGALTSEDLMPLTEMDGMWSLALHSDSFTGPELEFLGRAQKVRTLTLVGSALTDAACEHLAAAPVKDLVLVAPEITDDGISHLARLAELRSLDLSGAAQLTDAAAEHLARISSLRRLTLDSPQITDAGLTHLSRLPALKALALPSVTALTPAGLSSLANMPELEELRLPGAVVTPDAVEVLAGIKTLLKLDAPGVEAVDVLPLLRARPDFRFNGTEYSEAAIDRLARTAE